MLDVATLSWIIFPLTHGNTCLMLSHTTRRRLTCPVAMETAPASTMWPLFVAEIIQHAGQSQVSGLRSRPSGPLCELLDGVFNANAAFSMQANQRGRVPQGGGGPVAEGFS